MRALLFAAALLGGCSPFGGGSFACDRNDQCTGAGGRCEPTGYCSFADSSCASGQRYGSSSGPQSERCVGDDPDAGIVDAETPIDTAPGIDARTCFGEPLAICLTTLPSGQRTLPGTINTDSMCDQVEPQAGGPDLCVVTGQVVTVTGTRAEGSRPLVILATQSLSIMGNLDVGSRRQGAPGAGANSPGCASGAIRGENDGGGGGGGGGGGLGGKGGNAGQADTNRSNGGGPGTEATGGSGGSALTLTYVRGGCRGGDGGSTNGGNGGANQGNNHGTGSNGGGAVYLIAGTSISVGENGAIWASGGGGSGGNTTSGGGGGGGSGGLIGFDAPTITVDGRVAANGGGGGGGAGNNRGGDGGDGAQPGAMAQWDQRAAGGSGGTQVAITSGLGGAAGVLEGGVSSGSEGGSGGGGGGAGVIWVHGTVAGTQQFSPAPTPR